MPLHAADVAQSRSAVYRHARPACRQGAAHRRAGEPPNGGHRSGTHRSGNWRGAVHRAGSSGNRGDLRRPSCRRHSQPCRRLHRTIALRIVALRHPDRTIATVRRPERPNVAPRRPIQPNVAPRHPDQKSVAPRHREVEKTVHRVRETGRDRREGETNRRDGCYEEVSLSFPIAPGHADAQAVNPSLAANRHHIDLAAFRIGLAVARLAFMSTEHLVPPDLRALYHVREWRNAAGVLSTACPEEWADMIEVLRAFRLLRSEVLTAGGGLSPISQQVNGAFDKRGWKEKKFTTLIKVDDAEYASPTHAVDCFKGRVALELEWNNKDPFFDRDLNNFRLLFELRAIDVGVILTRASELQGIFDGLGKGKSYGNSTTHHAKLWPRLEGGGGGGCPVLTFAIKPALYVDDGPAALEAALRAKAERDVMKKVRSRKGRLSQLAEASPDAEEGQ